MKYIKTYESYLIEEKFDYNLILEKNDIKFFKSIQDKTMKTLSLQLYFAAHYTWGVAMLYPIINALINNSNVPEVSPQQIVFLTLFGITQILNLANNDVKKLREELEKDNLLHLAKKVKDSLLSVFNIFKFVSRSFGRIVDKFVDMVAYVAVGLPFTDIFTGLISSEGFNLDTLPQKAMVFGAGAALYSLKHLAETIIIMIKNKINNKQT